MGEATGFLKWRARDRRAPSGPGAAHATGTRSTSRSARGRCATQAGRCMDCGIPFCNNGCPLGNLIPDWNDLVYRDHWREAIERLHATNNFPEFTGRLCPAPCESACVLGINQDPVAIKQVEVEIVERAWDEGWIEPVSPPVQTGKKVAVVGSGPAGLAAAQQLTRAGPRRRRVRAGRPHRRPAALRHPRVQDGEAPSSTGASRRWRPRAPCSAPASTWASTSPSTSCAPSSTPIVLAGGATAWRDLPIPGRELGGIHQAMEYLPLGNRVQQGDLERAADHRRGQARRHHRRRRHRRRLPRHRRTARARRRCTSSRSCRGRPTRAARPTRGRTFANVFKVTSAHEEGGERVYCVNTERFLGDDDGNVRALRAHEVEMVDGKFEKIEGTRLRAAVRARAAGDGLPRPAAGGPARPSSASSSTSAATSSATTRSCRRVPGVFACGDMGRGQSLIVWAIAEGRSAAAGVDRYLMGETMLPAPIAPAELGHWSDGPRPVAGRIAYYCGAMRHPRTLRCSPA